MQPVINRDREVARLKLLTKIDAEQRVLAAIEAEAHLPAHARRTFTTIDPRYLIEDAEWRLRWIDCAPEGANFLLAPLQDKRGVPMGGVYDENVGPNVELRKARERRGLHPISGKRP